MHIAVTLLTILVAVKWGDWRHFRDYHPGMLFISAGGLLYEYIVQDYTMWRFHSDFLFSNELVVIIYATITMPLSILLYLSRFPADWLRRVGYILFWSLLYISFEWVLLMTGRISYANSWHFWYSLCFDLVMFSIIALHRFHPGRAYVLSLFVIVFLILYFHVPLDVLR